MDRVILSVNNKEMHNQNSSQDVTKTKLVLQKSSLCSKLAPKTRTISECSAVYVCSADALRDKPHWQKLTKLINCIIKQQSLTHQDTQVIDLIDEKHGKNILEYFYIGNPETVVAILQERIKYLQSISNNAVAEICDPVSEFACGYHVSDEEILLNELLKSLATLENEHNPTLMKNILSKLSEYEEKIGCLSFADRCNLAYLKKGLAKTYNRYIQQLLASGSLMNLLSPNTNQLHAKSAIQNLFNNLNQTFMSLIHDICIEHREDCFYYTVHKEIHTLFQNGFLNPLNYSLDENIRRLQKAKPELFAELLQMFSYEQQKQALPVNQQKFIDILKTELLKCWQIAILSKCQNLEVVDSNLQEQLSSLQKQAQQINYQLTPQVTNLLINTRAENILQYINNKALSSHWLLEIQLNRQQIVELLNSTSGDLLTVAIQSLDNFLQFQVLNDPDQYEEMLKSQDNLYKTQINYLLDQCRQLIDQPTNETQSKLKFQACTNQLLQLQEQRPNLNLINWQKNISHNLQAIGCRILSHGNVDVRRAVQDLTLEFQLKVEHGFNFSVTIQELMQQLPEQITQCAQHVITQIKNMFNIAYQTATQKISLTEAFKQSIQCQKGQTNSLTNLVKQHLADYERLCKQNPRMARVLAGNIMQTVAILQNTIGNQCELYDLFYQFQTRVQAETAASYLIEQFEPATTDLSDLSPECIESLKKMFALCKFFEKAPETIVGITGVSEVASQAWSGALGGTLWSTGKLMLRMAGTYCIKQSVSNMSEEEVRATNMALMTWQHGAREAGIRQQLMKSSATFIADKIKGQSTPYSLLKLILHPFLNRINHLTKSYHQWMEGAPIHEFILESVKIAIITMPIIAIIPAICLAIFYQPHILLGSIISQAPLSSFALLKLFDWLDPIQEMSGVIADKVSFLLHPIMPNLEQQAEKLTNDRLKAGGYELLKYRKTCEQFYNAYAEEYQQNNPRIFAHFENTYEQMIDSIEVQKELNNLKSMYQELSTLENMLRNNTINKERIMACVPENLHDEIPDEKNQLTYWVLGHIQELREIFLNNLGTEVLPLDENAMIALYKDFNKKLWIATAIKNNTYRKEFREILASKEITDDVRKMVKIINQNAFLQLANVITHNAISRTVGNQQMRQDDLDKFLSFHLNNNIGHENAVAMNNLMTVKAG